MAGQVNDKDEDATVRGDPRDAPPTANSKSALSSVTEFKGFFVCEGKPQEKYTYFSLYRFSTKYECALLGMGLLCALISGICVPMMVIQFGKLTNKMVIIDVVNANDTVYDERFLQLNRTPFCEPKEYVRPLEDTRNNSALKTHQITESIMTFAEVHTYIAIGLTILSSIYFMTWLYCGEKQIDRLITTYFEALLRKDMKWLDTTEDHDFANSIIENTSRIRDGIGEQVTIALALFSIFVISLVNAFWHGWELSCVSVLSIPVFFISTSIVASAEANQIVEEQNAYSKAGTLAEEVLLNIRTVMVYGGQKKEFHQFNERVEEDKLKIVKRTFHTSLANGAMWFITYGNYALSFWYGTKLVMDSQTMDCATGVAYSPEDMIVIFFSIYFGALNIALAFPIIQSVFVANKTAKEVMFTINSTVEVDNLSTDGFIPKNRAIGKVEIEDVYFSYPARKDVAVLNGVSLEVNPGMTCVLVGSSGCGKSTILKLLSKEYLADSGFIKVDGVDIRTYNTNWLRSQTAFVTQEGSLFDVTIEENIRFGKLDATMEEIHRVCKEVNAHEFIIQLKKGYQTMIGFQGSKLSGGQRQRLAIARALLRDPKILLLDEPTSALDNLSEAVVQDALKTASKNRTTFIVAHRLNTIKEADVILVFHKGKIVERGTHAELVNLKGHYYQLATGQHRTSTSDPKLLRQVQRKSAVELEEKHALDSVKSFGAATRFPFRASLTTTSPFNETIIKHAKNLKDIEREYQDQSSQNQAYTINVRRHTLVNFAEEDNLDIEHQMALTEETGASQTSGLNEHYSHIVLRQESEAAALQVLQDEDKLWKLFDKKHNFVKELDPMQTKFEFIKTLRMASHTRVLIIIGVIASILAGCALTLYGLIFGDVVGELSSLDEAKARSTFKEYAFRFLVVGGFAGVSVFAQSMALNLAGYITVDRIRKFLFFTFLRQDCGWFDDPDNNVATLNIRLNIDAGSMEYIIRSFYGAFFQCITTILVSISYSAIFGDMKLTLYCLFLVPIVIGSTLFDGWLGKIQQDRTTEAMEEISKMVLEVFENRHAVLTCQLEKHFITKLKALLMSTGKSKFKLIMTRSLAFGFAQASVFWAYSICMYLSKDEIVNGELEYKNVLKVGEALIFGLITVGSSLAIIPSFMKALEAGSRLCKLLARKANFDVEQDGVPVEKCDGQIEFKDVQFWHPHAKDVHILKGINFTVNPGQMIAIVGSSGSGKSTCVQLILRFHDTTGGFVKIDGRNICSLNCASLRSHMGLVEQEPRLFNRSVAENIAYGDNSKPIKLSDIIKAAKAANIHTFVTSLPESYETKTGPTSGSFLSGGQKQRIAIARALLRSPKILVLDEATSALDRDSEKLVQESIDSARVGRTYVAIAHRLSSIQNADLIIVLHQGNVVEFGTHEFLIGNKGLYSLLWTSQNVTVN